MKWTIELLKKAGFDIDLDIENENDNPCYSYPKIILNVLREIAPGNIVGEIREVYITRGTQNLLFICQNSIKDFLKFFLF